MGGWQHNFFQGNKGFNDTVKTLINDINTLKEHTYWYPVNPDTIIRENGTTTIPLDGARYIHFQGRFTQYTTSTGSWLNFTPFTIDTKNYNYMVRIPIYNWNNQTLTASVEISINGDNVVLQAYNLQNQTTNYYLWGDVLVKS